MATLSSVHLESDNSILYTGLMKAYMKNILESYPLVPTRVTFNLLYRDILYPALSGAVDILHILLLSSNVDNNSKSWLRDVKHIEESGTLDTAILDNKVRIKYPRRDDSTSQDRGLFECFIGIVMNKLRKKVPNFVLTLGAFKSSPVEFNSSGSLIDQFFDTKTSAVYHLVQERVEGQTLAAWLKGSPTSRKFYSLLIQLVFALSKAQDKKGFVHNALFASNIILRPSDLSTVTFQFGSQIYSMEVDREIPTIIDFTSARITYKGFGISYLANPTIFVPGKDLAKLVASCLALVNDKPIYTEISWINEFFHNFFDVSVGDYDTLLTRYHNFDLPDDTPLANLTPIDFINWFRGQNGEIFNKLVTVKPRIIRELSMTIKPSRPLVELEETIALIPSGIMKTFALSTYGKKYKSTKKEKDYDTGLLDNYSGFVSSNTAKIYAVNYNFPMSHQYDENIPIDYESLLPKLQIHWEILSNYIAFLRCSKTIGLTNSVDLQQVYISNDKLKHDVNIISNLPLYRLYQAAMAQELNIINGQVFIIYQDLYRAASWVKQLYPECAEYIDLVFLPTTEKMIDPVKHQQLVASRPREINIQYYYPPSTLEQFNQLYHSRELVKLANKIIIGPQNRDTRELERILFQPADDVKILSDLRKLHVPAIFDRGPGKSKEINSFLKYLPQVKFGSYLDFGGGDGAVSSAVASLLKLPRNKAWSIDIESWFGRTEKKDRTNITYLTRKEEQPVPLPDQSADIITCLQVLHHIKNIDYTMKELKRICKYALIIREHDCQTNSQRTCIDLEHSMYELSVEADPHVHYLDSYTAWYRSKKEWNEILLTYGFKLVHATEPTGPTRYWYGVYVVV